MSLNGCLNARRRWKAIGLQCAIMILTVKGNCLQSRRVRNFSENQLSLTGNIWAGSCLDYWLVPPQRCFGPGMAKFRNFCSRLFFVSWLGDFQVDGDSSD